MFKTFDMSNSLPDSERELSEAVTSYHKKDQTKKEDEETSDSSSDSGNELYTELVSTSDQKYCITEFEDGVESDEEEIDDYLEPYMGEPLADEAWIANYNREREEQAQQMEEFQRRLEGEVSTNSWCKCGNCNVELLKNPKECSCCHEVPGCVASLVEDDVLEVKGKKPICIIEHPGFEPACINRWTLRISANMFKTRERRVYRKDGSEER